MMQYTRSSTGAASATSTMQASRSTYTRIMLLCFLIVCLDGFDTTLIGYVAPALLRFWHVDRVALGPVVSAALLGTAVGAALSGVAADRYGRKIVLVAGVSLFGMLTILSAFAGSPGTLVALRFVTGLGLGATISNASTFVAEHASARGRARAVTAVLCGFSVGASLGGFASSYCLARWGWQSVMLLCGGLACALVPLLITALPADAMANSRADGNEEYAAPGVRGLFGALLSGKFLVPNVTLWGAFFMSSLSVYLIVGWLPTLIADAGMSVSQGTLVGGVFQAGGTVGVLTIGLLMDKWNAHKIMAGAWLLAALFLCGLSHSTHHFSWLAITACATGFCLAGAASGIFALAAGTYPAAIRATGTSWMSASGRVGAIISGFAGAHLLSTGWTFERLTMLLAVPLIMAAALIVFKYVMLRRAELARP